MCRLKFYQGRLIYNIQGGADNSKETKSESSGMTFVFNKLGFSYIGFELTSAMQETPVQFLGQEDPLEKG